MSSLILAGFLAVIIIIAIGAVIKVVFFHRRSVNVVSHLHRGDVDRFLKEIDEDIKAAKAEKITYALLVNKSAGLTYKGDFEASLTILKSIDPARLPKMFRTLHVNNALVTLLLLGRLDDARVHYEANREALEQTHRNPMIDNALRGTRAMYEYHLGDKDRSRSILEELLNLERPPVYEAGTRFYLGRIALDNGDAETAETHFRRAEELAPSTYIPAAIEKLRAHRT